MAQSFSTYLPTDHRGMIARHKKKTKIQKGETRQSPCEDWTTVSEKPSYVGLFWPWTQQSAKLLKIKDSNPPWVILSTKQLFILKNLSWFSSSGPVFSIEKASGILIFDFNFK